MPRGEVVLIGLGIPEDRAVTLEARRALAECAVIYAYNPDNPELRQSGRELRGVGEFATGFAREALDPLGERIAAEARTRRVGVAVYGDALVYEPLSEAVVRACARAKTPWRAVPGIASIGAVLAQAKVAITRGALLHVGDDEVYARRAPDPDAWTVVYKAFQARPVREAVVGTALAALGPRHPAAVVEAEGYGAALTRWTDLGGLAKWKGGDRPYATLLVAPRGFKPPRP